MASAAEAGRSGEALRDSARLMGVDPKSFGARTARDFDLTSSIYQLDAFRSPNRTRKVRRH